jgi:cystathionine beta-lyase/cystathionine gamma-synthase
VFPATRAIHDGQPADPVTGAVNTPVYLTSTYKQRALGTDLGYVYARTGNPTRTALQRNLAAIEGARHAFAFASGMAATNTCLSLLKSGDHVVCVDNLYGGTWRILERVYRQWGLATTFVDATRTEDLLDAVTPRTRLIWLESPSNPLLKLVDLKAAIRGVRRIAGRRALVVVDNTFASPLLQSPLRVGADIVMYSLTKYHAGHSDVLAGALITDHGGLAEKLRFYQNAVGAVLGPLDCYLVLRGIKTMSLRVARHAENAMKVARFLERHPQVGRVNYPGLRSHPQHALARRQMRGFGSMVSFELKGGPRAARRFAGATRLFALAESLGGVKSLLAVPWFMTHASVPKDVMLRVGITEGLVRLSVGLEDPRDLVEDLAQAFRRARAT